MPFAYKYLPKTCVTNMTPEYCDLLIAVQLAKSADV